MAFITFLKPESTTEWRWFVKTFHVFQDSSYIVIKATLASNVLETSHQKKKASDPSCNGKDTYGEILIVSQQHRGRVRAYGRGRGHVQGVSHPPQEPEVPGCGRGDHPPESRHQARDLVWSDHQLLDQKVFGSGRNLDFIFR